jgi:hypothetical protein
MEFLENYGFSDDDIREIVSSNDDGVIRNISMNKENVIDVLEYLKELGVNDNSLKDLFVHQIGMFHRTKEEIKVVFDEYEIESIVKSLNYDVNTVDLIEFN